MNLQTALQLIALIEAELPTAVGLVNALKAANAGGVTVDTLLNDADTRLQNVLDRAKAELAKGGA